MLYYDEGNLVTVTKVNLIHEMPRGYGTLTTTAVRLQHSVSCRAAPGSKLLSKSPGDLRRGLSYNNIWPSYKSNLVASWMHLHNCRCIQERQRMLLQSLRALYLAPGKPGSIWIYFRAPVRSTGGSGRIGCGFRTDLHCADVLHITSNSSIYTECCW